MDCYSDLALELKNLLYDKMNLSAISPTRYCFSNRKKTRYIANLNSIINATRVKFPNITWEYSPDNYSVLVNMAKEFASYRLIYMPTGSNAIKTCFMHNYTVMITPCSATLDISIATKSASSLVFILQFRANMTHRKRTPNFISVSDSVKNIERGLYCLEHRKWPTDPGNKKQ